MIYNFFVYLSASIRKSNYNIESGESNVDNMFGCIVLCLKEMKGVF